MKQMRLWSPRSLCFLILSSVQGMHSVFGFQSLESFPWLLHSGDNSQTNGIIRAAKKKNPNYQLFHLEADFGLRRPEAFRKLHPNCSLAIFRVSAFISQLLPYIIFPNKIMTCKYLTKCKYEFLHVSSLISLSTNYSLLQKRERELFSLGSLSTGY